MAAGSKATSHTAKSQNKHLNAAPWLQGSFRLQQERFHAALLGLCVVRVCVSHNLNFSKMCTVARKLPTVPQINSSHWGPLRLWRLSEEILLMNEGLPAWDLVLKLFDTTVWFDHVIQSQVVAPQTKMLVTVDNVKVVSWCPDPAATVTSCFDVNAEVIVI